MTAFILGGLHICTQQKPKNTNSHIDTAPVTNSEIDRDGKRDRDRDRKTHNNARSKKKYKKNLYLPARSYALSHRPSFPRSRDVSLPLPRARAHPVYLCLCVSSYLTLCLCLYVCLSLTVCDFPSVGLSITLSIHRSDSVNLPISAS